MASKKPRLQFTEDSGSAADSRMRKPAQPKLLTDEQKAKARKEQLRFGKKENAAPIDPNTRQGVVRKGVAKRDTLSARASSCVIKREAAEANQDENVGTQALQEGVATAESSIREIENARYGHKLRQVEKAGKLEKKADKANLETQYREAMEKTDAATSNPISRWQQRRRIRKEYYEAKNAAQNAANTAKTARSVTERLKDGLGAIRTALSSSTGLRSVLAAAMAFLLIVAPFQSCSVITGGVLTTVTATSWPADDIQITRADVQYRKAGYSKVFFEAHREEITLHKAAKDAFQKMGVSKLPKVKELSEEYATVLEQKKSLYAQYRLSREEMREYQKALHNTEVFFDMDRIGERDNRTQSEVEQKNQPAK